MYFKYLWNNVRSLVILLPVNPKSFSVIVDSRWVWPLIIALNRFGQFVVRYREPHMLAIINSSSKLCLTIADAWTVFLALNPYMYPSFLTTFLVTIVIWSEQAILLKTDTSTIHEESDAEYSFRKIIMTLYRQLNVIFWNVKIKIYVDFNVVKLLIIKGNWTKNGNRKTAVY